MKLYAEIDGRQAVLDLDGEQDSLTFRFGWNGENSVEQSCAVLEVEPGVYSVMINDRSLIVTIVPAADRWHVETGGRVFEVSLSDPRDGGRRAAAVNHDGPLRLSVPMPGKVVRVLAAAGDQVEAGQGLVVVEAMKMQNEVKAPRAGRIGSLNATVGTAVMPGETLVVLQ